MKKFALIALISTLMSAPLMAENGGFNGPGTSTVPAERALKGGFSGPNVSETSVANALKLTDDSWVILRGNIVKQLDNKHYEFTDGTGTITVEIDHKKWRGQTIMPTDKVEIRGEIDKDWSSREVSVKEINLIK
ncbi:YgiW/YdeI family stress tolerance OB fold protein [Moellerella wisconsensis]|uniref:YgiW/YdeI family stress tolerance OB fold protein n=1 Tax=Moellerella wisconsensis TaxID=158849 RepID=UPI003075EEE7